MRRIWYDAASIASLPELDKLLLEKLIMSTGVKWEKIGHQVAIAGQVSDQETGQTIHGAIVEITDCPTQFQTKRSLRALQYGVDWETLPERLDRRRTAIDGYFYFVDLPDGKYKLKATLPGASTRYHSAEIEVSITSGKLQYDANIDLPPSGVKGEIKNQKGDAVARAKVQIYPPGEYTFSDDEGKYLLSGLEAPKNQEQKRTVNLSISAQGYQQITKPVQFSLGEVVVENVTLQPNNEPTAL